jgi:TP901 family phage tail tape measure protein
MKRLGPDGVEAFNQMANAIAAADTKLFSLQGGMKRLASTFMNTVRYQASAAAINAMTSAITNAISYTKELDKSLTDIMMVTDYSREEMNSFAIAANKAAKALSISTNAYAKASLIYFQQGYDIGEAMKRAETTIRLAHATGESAQEVSEWMTAIWNNFDNGTKALEYYGDVLAKLGAKTASSADEIA